MATTTTSSTTNSVHVLHRPNRRRRKRDPHHHLLDPETLRWERERERTAKTREGPADMCTGTQSTHSLIFLKLNLNLCVKSEQCVYTIAQRRRDFIRACEMLSLVSLDRSLKCLNPITTPRSDFLHYRLPLLNVVLSSIVWFVCTPPFRSPLPKPKRLSSYAQVLEGRRRLSKTFFADDSSPSKMGAKERERSILGLKRTIFKENSFFSTCCLSFLL